MDTDVTDYQSSITALQSGPCQLNKIADSLWRSLTTLAEAKAINGYLYQGTEIIKLMRLLTLTTDKAAKAASQLEQHEVPLVPLELPT